MSVGLCLSLINAYAFIAGSNMDENDWMTDHDQLVDHLANIGSLIGPWELEESAKEAATKVRKRREEEWKSPLA